MDQPQLAKSFTLASATLSGGMRSAVATGTRPARLVEALDKYFLGIGSTSSTGVGITMDPDGLHFWFSDSTNNRIRKIRISDGATITTFTSNASDGGTRVITTPRGLTRRGNFIYGANAGANNYIIQIDTVNLVCRLYSNSLVTAPSHAVSAASGLVWVRAGTGATSGTYNEMSLSGTGDSAAAVAAAGARTQASMYDCVADETGTYMYFQNGTTITRLTLSSNATVVFTNYTSTTADLPGYGLSAFRNGMAMDRVLNQPIFANSSTSLWDRLKADASDVDATAFSVAQFGSPVALYNSSGIRTPFDIMADGSGMIMFAFTNSGLASSPVANAAYINLGVQRARWSWTPGAAVKLLRFLVPGYQGNQLGDIENMPGTPAMLQAEYNFKRTKMYYSLDGGATRYEVDNGSDNTLYADGRPLLVTASQTVTFDVDIQRNIYHPWGPRPFIGGPGGEGPTIDYQRTEPRRRAVGAI
jgi:hypothetical protein